MMPPFSTRSRCPVASQFYARTRCSTPTPILPYFLTPYLPPTKAGVGSGKKRVATFFEPLLQFFKPGVGKRAAPYSLVPCHARYVQDSLLRIARPCPARASCIVPSSSQPLDGLTWKY